MSDLRNDIINIARGYIGTPFRHQGRLPGASLDCAGLIVCALRQAGIACGDVAGYGRLPHKGLLKKALDDDLHTQQISAPEAGCILLFKIRRDPQHLALCTGETIIHAYETIGRVVEERLSPFWLSRIVSCYRVIHE